MIRKNIDGDISVEEFEKVLKPFIDDLSKIASLMQEGENFASRLPKQTNEQYMNSFLE